jgi:hypothetical protein
VSVPVGSAVPHRSSIHSLWAENHSPRTVQACSLAADQLQEDRKRQRDRPTKDLGRHPPGHVEGFLVRLAGQGLAAATPNQGYRCLARFLRAS